MGSPMAETRKIKVRSIATDLVLYENNGDMSNTKNERTQNESRE